MALRGESRALGSRPATSAHVRAALAFVNLTLKAPGSDLPVRLAVIVATVDFAIVLVVFLIPRPVTVTLPAPRPPTFSLTDVLLMVLLMIFVGHDRVWM